MLPLDPVTLLLSIVTFIFLATVLYREKEHLHPNYPPGPRPLPIIGNILNLNVQKPFLSFQELAKTYGPVFSIKIGVQKVVVLCGYDTVKEALVNHAEEFSDRPNVPVFMDYSRGNENVQKEIEKVIGSAEPQVIHRQQMPYTDAVIHEIQRFANLVPTNAPHMTTQDVTLKGFFIPKGITIIPSLTSVLQDNKYFKKPHEFYPQHFLDLDGNFVKNEAFLPFSAGKRSCAGENMAKMELFLFFTKLLQNFTFKAPPGAKLDLNAAVGFTSCPQRHNICAIPRN